MQYVEMDWETFINFHRDIFQHWSSDGKVIFAVDNTYNPELCQSTDDYFGQWSDSDAKMFNTLGDMSVQECAQVVRRLANNW